MLALPWLAVTFVKGDAGMAVCFLLFFAIDPLYSVAIGALREKICSRQLLFGAYQSLYSFSHMPYNSNEEDAFYEYEYYIKILTISA